MHPTKLLANSTANPTAALSAAAAVSCRRTLFRHFPAAKALRGTVPPGILETYSGRSKRGGTERGVGGMCPSLFPDVADGVAYLRPCRGGGKEHLLKTNPGGKRKLKGNHASQNDRRPLGA